MDDGARRLIALARLVAATVDPAADDRDDIEGHILVALYEAAPDERDAHASRIARDAAIDYLRRAHLRRHARPPDLVPLELAADVPAPRGPTLLAPPPGSMHPRDRVVATRALEGATDAEIAAELGLSRSRVTRLRQQVAHLFDRSCRVYL